MGQPDVLDTGLMDWLHRKQKIPLVMISPSEPTRVTYTEGPPRTGLPPCLSFVGLPKMKQYILRYFQMKISLLLLWGEKTIKCASSVSFSHSSVIMM